MWPSGVKCQTGNIPSNFVSSLYSKRISSGNFCLSGSLGPSCVSERDARSSTLAPGAFSLEHVCTVGAVLVPAPGSLANHLVGECGVVSSLYPARAFATLHVAVDVTNLRCGSGSALEHSKSQTKGLPDIRLLKCGRNFLLFYGVAWACQI